MSDDNKLYEAISRASEVEALLGNGQLNKALDEMYAELVDMWVQSLPREVAFRERLHLEINLLLRFRKHLRSILDDGKFSRADLEFKNKRSAA